MLQPLISFNLIQQWLKVFPIPQLSTGLARLKALMNFYPHPFSYLMNESEFLFSSAAFLLQLSDRRGLQQIPRL
jgi:hypothetical protein